MRKSLIVVLIALVLIPASLTAAPFLQIGPLASYNKTVVDIEELGDEDGWEINNFAFGADIRLTPLKNLSLDIPVTVGFGKDGSFSFATVPTVNVNIPVGGLLDIAIGAGPQLDFQYAGGNIDRWTMNGLPLDSAGDAFAMSKLAYRLGVTVNLSFLSFGLNATMPCKAPFSSSSLDMINPMWESTRVSAVVLFNIG